MLTQRRPELRFESIPLVDAIDVLRDATGANLHVEWPALEAAGIDRNALVSVRLANPTLGMALRYVLREAGGDKLTYAIDGNVIRITTRALADERMIRRVYPIFDLIVDVPDFEAPRLDLRGGRSGENGGSGGLMERERSAEKAPGRRERAEQLIQTIQSTIEPDVWDVNGGRARIRYLNGALVVTAPFHVHEQLVRQGR